MSNNKILKQIPHRITVTEKGNEFIQTTMSLTKLLNQSKSPQKQKNSSNLPPLKENPRYSILETFNTIGSEIANIHPFKNKRAQSLFFYENNKKLMNFHLKSHTYLKQKPTIFSSIRDPFDKDRGDFHKSSKNILSSIKSNFNSTVNSQFFEEMNGNETKTKFLSPKNYMLGSKNLLTEIQNSFNTKPLVKHLNEIEIMEKVTSKKQTYFNDKYKYFQELKDNIQINNEKKTLNVKSAFMNEFSNYEKVLDSDLELYNNEKNRFVRRISKYYQKKFLCKNMKYSHLHESKNKFEIKNY